MTHMTVAEARSQTLDLIHEHGLVGWSVEFCNAKRTAGLCHHAAMKITLSKYLLAQRSYEDSWQTITHEIAHALVGAKHGHDYVWQRQHKALGGNGRRCFLHVDETAPWKADCGRGCIITRYRRPQRLAGMLCKRHRLPITFTENRKVA